MNIRQKIIILCIRFRTSCFRSLIRIFICQVIQWGKTFSILELCALLKLKNLHLAFLLYNYWPEAIILTRWSINSYVYFKGATTNWITWTHTQSLRNKKNELELFIYALRHDNWNCYRIGTRLSDFEKTLIYQWLQ